MSRQTEVKAEMDQEPFLAKQGAIRRSTKMKYESAGVNRQKSEPNNKFNFLAVHSR